MWIGITIAAQAFQATPGDHAPAVVVGLLPAMAAWGLLILEGALRSAGTTIEAVGITALSSQLPIIGLISLERGFIFTSLILAALTVNLIEGRYLTAAAWACAAAVISATGLMHGFRLSGGNVVNAYGPSHTWPFVFGYLIIATIFVSLWRLQKNRDEPA